MRTRRMTQGAVVAPYIYEYAPGGRLQGFQVRFKRCSRAEDGTRLFDNRSAYFCISKYESRRWAFAAACRWRDENKPWLRDPTVEATPKPELAELLVA